MEKRPTLLLVEDDLNDAALFRLAFEKLYPQVQLETAYDAAEAMHCLHHSGRFREQPNYTFPYAVIVDLELPGISGTSLVRWMRLQSQFGKLLIAAWTGSRDGKDIAHLYRLGVNSFLVKASVPELLARDIREMHEFWQRMGLLANFVPQIDFYRKPSRVPREDFFYRIEEWPGFQPPAAGG
jgi:CheY-like chemotaxis protein